jgi:N-methylhydantoinase A
VRFSADTGGTFTDLVVEDDDGHLLVFRAARRMTVWALDAFEQAAGPLVSRGEAVRARRFPHATTRAINAILTGSTARTAS